MTSSMSSSFQKSGGFIYSLLPMYTVSFKFVQALLLFKIAGEGSEALLLFKNYVLIERQSWT